MLAHAHTRDTRAQHVIIMYYITVSDHSICINIMLGSCTTVSIVHCYNYIGAQRRRHFKLLCCRLLPIVGHVLFSIGTTKTWTTFGQMFIFSSHGSRFPQKYKSFVVYYCRAFFDFFFYQNKRIALYL